MSMQALLLVDWVCLYGYSLVPYLGAVMICVVPLGILSWIALIAATVMSVSLVVRNVAAPLLSSDVGQAKAPPVIMAILGMHLIFLFFMKFSFYHKK
jgi:protein YIPF1/2